MKSVNEYQGEFIEILLKEPVVYPWNPCDPEAEYYFSQQQEHCCFAESLNADELLKIDNFLYPKKPTSSLTNSYPSDL